MLERKIMQAAQKNYYDEKFYNYTFSKSSPSADKVTDVALQLFSPKSVCDVGCGEGVWLSTYMQKGITSIAGLDGAYVDQSRLRIPSECFTPCDLSQPFEIEGTFDIVQSFEVAEHLPEDRSMAFISTLTSAAKIILFSAATPGQGGVNHINEQPLDYWRALFLKRGYRAYDLVRPRIANETTVAPWYRYNIIAYISDEAPTELLSRFAQAKIPENMPIPNVAPLWYRLRCGIIGALPYWLQQVLAKIAS